MAGHIQDRWYKTEPDAAGKPRRVRTDHYGTGMRYRARYIGPDGTSLTDRSDWLISGSPTLRRTCLAGSTSTPPRVG